MTFLVLTPPPDHPPLPSPTETFRLPSHTPGLNVTLLDAASGSPAIVRVRSSDGKDRRIRGQLVGFTEGRLVLSGGSNRRIALAPSKVVSVHVGAWLLSGHDWIAEQTISASGATALWVYNVHGFTARLLPRPGALFATDRTGTGPYEIDEIQVAFDRHGQTGSVVIRTAGTSATGPFDAVGRADALMGTPHMA